MYDQLNSRRWSTIQALMHGAYLGDPLQRAMHNIDAARRFHRQPRGLHGLDSKVMVVVWSVVGRYGHLVVAFRRQLLRQGCQATRSLSKGFKDCP